MYGLSGFVENLNSTNMLNVQNVQNCVNSSGNCVPQILGLCGFAKNIQYPQLPKFNGKLCTLNVWIAWICKKFEYPKNVNST